MYNYLFFKADFFNNYLRDTERPMPEDGTVNKPFSPSPAPPGPGGHGDEAAAGAGVAAIGGAWGRSAQMMTFGRGTLPLRGPRVVLCCVYNNRRRYFSEVYI